MNTTSFKTIEIELDIYHYLKSASELGEPTSAVLRRLLGLKQNGPTTASVSVAEESELSKFLCSTDMVYARGVVGKFLLVLRWLHDRDPEGFARIEKIQGRGRLYFAKDSQTLESAGTNVNPKQIPGTPYWVITTTSTALKKEILERVMRELGYAAADIRAATGAIDR